MCEGYSNMLLSSWFEIYQQAKLKTATVRKFVKVGVHKVFSSNVKWKKIICIIEFLGKKADWENWLKKFLSYVKHNDYIMLLVSSGSTSGVDKIPMQEEYENALKGNADLNKNH